MCTPERPRITARLIATDTDAVAVPHGDEDATPALRTAHNKLGNGNDSEVVWRMSRRNESAFAPSMPPLGTEEVDEEAVDLITTWIEQL